MLSLIGSVPYLWNNPFGQQDMLNLFTNSVFESASGFTPTGLSIITNLDAMPRSLVFYRSLTELIGGLGIVFLILAFFYKGDTIQNISRIMGFIDISKNIKRSFVSILIVYLSYLAVLTGIFYLLGFTNIVNVASTLISGLMTGGLSPTNNFAAYTSFPASVLLMVAMLLGSISFVIHFKVFSGRFREAFKKELLLFFGIIVVAIAGIFLFFKLNLEETIFHVISASSGTGFSTWNFSAFDVQLKLVFIVLMFIGGMSISTGGGIKILRLAVLMKSIPVVVRSLLFEKDAETSFDKKAYSNRDIAVNAMFVLLSIIIVFLGTVALTTGGFSFIDSFFEAASAFSTAGLSTGITSLSLAVHLKWVLISLMLIGRIEIMPFLIMFVKESESPEAGHERRGRKLARLTQP
jgi:trk system potassium uptake protein TrkH